MDDSDVVADEETRSSLGAVDDAARRRKQYHDDVTHYIADMLLQLRSLVSEIGLDKVGSSIDEAYYEAYAQLDGQLNKKGPRPRARVTT